MSLQMNSKHAIFKKEVHINKNVLLSQRINILSSPCINRNINRSNYLSYDIANTYINEECKHACIVAFRNRDLLNVVKQQSCHPYVISELTIDNIIDYMIFAKNDLMIINKWTCDPFYKNVKYTTLYVDHQRIHENVDTIPLKIYKMTFTARDHENSLV